MSTQNLIDAIREGNEEAALSALSSVDPSQPLVEKPFPMYGSSTPQEEFFPPLFVAAWHGAVSIALALLDAGADPTLVMMIRPHSSGPTQCMSLMHASAWSGADQLIDRAMASGVPVDEGSHSTPLCYAAAAGHSETVQKLIEYGASVNSRDEFERTPLFYGAIYGQVESTRLLIESGCDVRAIDHNSRNALHHLLSESAGRWGFAHLEQPRRRGDPKETLDILIRAMEPPTDEEIREAMKAASPQFLDHMCERGLRPGPPKETDEKLGDCCSANKLQVYLKHGMLEREHTANALGNVILETKRAKERFEGVSALIEAGSDPRRPGLLAKAAQVKDTKVARELLKHGANPNDADSGHSALIWAIDKRAKPLATLLLQWGALWDFTIECNYGLKMDRLGLTVRDFADLNGLDAAAKWMDERLGLATSRVDISFDPRRYFGFNDDAYGLVVVGRCIDDFTLEKARTACHICDRCRIKSPLPIAAVPTTDLSEGSGVAREKDDPLGPVIVGCVAMVVRGPLERQSFAESLQGSELQRAFDDMSTLDDELFKSICDETHGTLTADIKAHLIACGPLASAVLSLSTGDRIEVSFDAYSVREISIDSGATYTLRASKN